MFVPNQMLRIPCKLSVCVCVRAYSCIQQMTCNGNIVPNEQSLRTKWFNFAVRLKHTTSMQRTTHSNSDETWELEFRIWFDLIWLEQSFGWFSLHRDCVWVIRCTSVWKSIIDIVLVESIASHLHSKRLFYETSAVAPVFIGSKRWDARNNSPNLKN